MAKANLGQVPSNGETQLICVWPGWCGSRANTRQAGVDQDAGDIRDLWTMAVISCSVM
jgi:hypothetical protein